MVGGGNELAERRRLREDLRSRGIPVPLQLMEPEVVAAGGIVGGGRGGGGGGSAAGRRERKLVNMWACTRERCHRWNWPARVACSACGWAKTSTARRRVEEWEVSRLPSWACEEAAPPATRRPSAMAEVAQRRIPGLEHDNGRGGGRGGGTAVGGGSQGLSRRDADPRRTAPGTLDGGRRTDEDGGGGDGADRRQVDGNRDGEWVSVVRGAGGKGKREPRGGAGEGGAAPGSSGASGGQPRDQQRRHQQHHQASRAERQHGEEPQPEHRVADEVAGEGAEGGESQRAPQPRDLPPMRLVDIPAIPRRAIARKVEAAEERVGRLQERGAEESKLHRAREDKERLVRELRAAGGATEKTLSFSIKSEDDRVERAEKALRKALEEKETRQARIVALQAELLEDDESIARHRQRLQAALEYREYLATQKLLEVSERTMQYLKTLAAAISPQCPQQAQAQAWALRAGAVGTWSEEIHMAGGDTESEGGESVVAPEGASVDAASDRTRLDLQGDGGGGGAEGANEELARMLDEAQCRLEELRREQAAALRKVDGPLVGDGKRMRLEGGSAGGGDSDVEMVPALTGQQVATLFGRRLQEAEERVRHFQILLAREDVAPTAADGDVATRSVGQQPSAPAAPAPEVEGRSSELPRGAGGTSQGEEGPRGRPLRRPGYESWVTAEEQDAAREETHRSQQKPPEGRRHSAQRPRTASRDEGPGRCRWSAGPRRATVGRQRSAEARSDNKVGWEEVERQYQKQQLAAHDLESRVRDHRQIEQQERMQQLQEAERREAAKFKVAQEAREIEARIEAAEAAPRGPVLPAVGVEAGSQAVPTYGPTGQRLDEQQHLLRAAAAGAAAERSGPTVRPPSVPRRRTRWGEESESEEEGGRERSQRGARGPRPSRGAMED